MFRVGFVLGKFGVVLHWLALFLVVALFIEQRNLDSALKFVAVLAGIMRELRKD